jgi:hypothetical protein
MTALTDKIQNGLDEGRTLFLATEVMIGFGFRAIFEQQFEQLPEYMQYIKLGGLSMLLIAAAILIFPGTFHHIAERSNDTPRLNKIINLSISLALLPFALGLGADLFVTSSRIIKTKPSLIIALIAILIAYFMWYGLGWYGRRNPNSTPMPQEQTPLVNRIRHVLTEARMILPGAQALLAFQFITILTESFDRLSYNLQVFHLISLSLVGLATILLMTPAAYHRIAERGEDTESFFRLASILTMVATVPLALGITGDYYIVIQKVTNSHGLSLVSSLIMLALFLGLWFGYTFYKRQTA